MASYVVIDFETANERRDSPCAIGAVRVLDGKVEQSWDSLIDPEQPFTPRNTGIHGLDATDVKRAPIFPEILEKLVATAQGTEVLVAHWAAFDMQVLAATAARYEQPLPKFKFACTVIFGRRWFTGLPKYSLGYLVEQFGIDKTLGSNRHHDALWDALAAKEIAELGLQQTGAATWEEAAAQAGISLGSVSSNFTADSCEPGQEVLDPDGCFVGKTVCFIGKFTLMTRRGAEENIAKAGGQLTDDVTIDTDMLVVGGAQTGNGQTEEVLKAAEGNKIEILSEKEFFIRLWGWKAL